MHTWWLDEIHSLSMAIARTIPHYFIIAEHCTHWSYMAAGRELSEMRFCKSLLPAS